MAVSTRTHQKVFLTNNGDGPWPCHFCKELVYGPIPNGKTKYVAIVHHIDEDRSNNDKLNLVVAHHSCHSSYHATHPPNDVTQSDQAKRGWKTRKLQGNNLANAYCTTRGMKRSNATSKGWITRKRNAL